MLRKNPGFTALAVLALAVGIGANTAIFSLAWALLRKPVTLPDLDRLTMIVNLAPSQNMNWNPVSPADFLDWQSQSRSFDQMAAYRVANLNLTGIGEPERVIGSFVTANYFNVLGVRVAMGAQKRDVLGLVLRRGTILTLAGLIVGVPLSFLLARSLAGLFFGVGATDLVIFSGAILVLTGIAILACYIPARRAMRIDPVIALRCD
jgi:putative ABC transport system permease protein